MRSEWQRVPLASLVDDRGITYGVVQPGRPVEGGTPIVRVNNFAGGGLDMAHALTIEPEIAANYKRSRLRGGEILISLVGTTGLVARVGPEAAGWNVARAVGVVPILDDALASWVAIYLRSPQAQRHFNAYLNTTVQRTLNLKDLATTEIALPPAPEQRRIAAVLGALDTKIDHCLHLAARLERTAEALYAAAVTRASEATTLGSLGTVGGGGTPRSGIEEYWEPGEVSWLTPTDMTALEMPVALTTRRAISELGLAKSSAKLLPQGAVLMTSRATVGLTAIAAVPLATNQGFITVQPADDFSSPTVLFAIRSVLPRVHALSGGSTFPEINKSNFKSIEVRVPSGPAKTDFETATDPLFALLTEQGRQITRLRALRDELLPKLVSGRLRVAEDYNPDAALATAG